MRAHWLAALCTLSLASSARAQVTPSLDLRHIQPPLHHHSGMVVDSTATQGHGEVNAAVWAHYEYEPLVVEDAAGNRVAAIVENRLTADYQVAFGLLDWITLGATVPAALYQQGDSTEALFEGGGRLPPTTLGDILLRSKVTALGRKGELGLGLAASAVLSLPTGDPRSYMGNDAATGELVAIADYVWTYLAVRGHFGYHLLSVPREFLGEVYGDSLPWAVGASFSTTPVASRVWELFASARGEIAVEPSLGASPQSWAAAGLSARVRFDDASLLAGAELPLSDGAGTPVVRATLALTWAPRAHDTDRDGILDESDGCPNVAEDVDGLDDHDGCPDPDNDGDGIDDRLDVCPNQAEDFDGFSDEDGCPELQLGDAKTEPRRQKVLR